MDKFLWKFYWDCGRQGDLEGLFVATEEEVQKAIGQYMYFGEVLGKHSEIYGTLDEGDVGKIDVPSSVVEQLIPHLGHDWSGFNPLDYVKCEECGERNEYCSCDEDEEGKYAEE